MHLLMRRLRIRVGCPQPLRKERLHHSRFWEMLWSLVWLRTSIIKAAIPRPTLLSSISRSTIPRVSKSWAAAPIRFRSISGSWTTIPISGTAKRQTSHLTFSSIKTSLQKERPTKMSMSGIPGKILRPMCIRRSRARLIPMSIHC